MILCYTFSILLNKKEVFRLISREIAQRVLQRAAATGADYAELFAENTVNHSINMISDKVDSIKDTTVA